jgi:hypothetical protein
MSYFNGFLLLSCKYVSSMKDILSILFPYYSLNLEMQITSFEEGFFFTCDLQQFGDILLLLQFPPPIKLNLTATI